MMERHEHTNSWADKLQEVPLPDAGDSWNAMEVLLDKEMPAARQQDKRRWLLLLLLLLLLIGVCNCPRLSQIRVNHAPGAAGTVTVVSDGSGGEVPGRGSKSAGPGADVMAPPGQRPAGPGPVSPGAPAAEARTPEVPVPEVPAPSVPGSQVPAAPGARASVRATPESSVSDNPSPVLKKTADLRHKPAPRPSRSTLRIRQPQTETDESLKNARSGVPAAATAADGTSSAGNPPGRITPSAKKSKEKKIPETEEDAIGGEPGKDTATASFPKPGGNSRSAKIPVSPRKSTKTPEKKNDEKDDWDEDKRGLVAGIGFNQFFSIGQQQKSDYNSGGTSGGVGDYLPVPMIRYYFSNKLYVQLEAQFNTPQYTKKGLIASQSPGDTLSPGRVQQSSIVIKKLFYFNLPLSVHYSPFKNLYAGAGLQYSRLSNGVGLLEDKVLTTGNPDSVKSAKIYNFKGDSTYQKMKTNEFRFLLDVNYTYKKFILGVRYNQALSKFLNVRISDTQVTQSRNSSLQIYLRYILWDNRKRKGLSSK